jgi:hypothetical protein
MDSTVINSQHERLDMKQRDMLKLASLAVLPMVPRVGRLRWGTTY